MIAARTSQLRYDADTNARNETLKYYYDGQNVIAEYDESDNRSRRYIHGTRGIDERAVMLSGPFYPDTYYYMLQELDTVTGLITKNGSLAEAYTYDAYGKVSVWGYPPSDFNRNGDSDFLDVTEFNLAYDSSPATDPMADLDYDGDVDAADFTILESVQTGSGPPVMLFASGVGNPYFFTGRRLHFMEANLTGEDPAENKQVQYNRARHYDPLHGRWLQRDPIGYVDGMNLYEYVRSRPMYYIDPFGLYGVKGLLDEIANFFDPRPTPPSNDPPPPPETPQAVAPEALASAANLAEAIDNATAPVIDPVVDYGPPVVQAILDHLASEVSGGGKEWVEGAIGEDLWGDDLDDYHYYYCIAGTCSPLTASELKTIVRTLKKSRQGLKKLLKKLRKTKKKKRPSQYDDHKRRSKEQGVGDPEDLQQQREEILRDYPDQPLGKNDQRMKDAIQRQLDECRKPRPPDP